MKILGLPLKVDFKLRAFFLFFSSSFSTIYSYILAGRAPGFSTGGFRLWIWKQMAKIKAQGKHQHPGEGVVQTSRPLWRTALMPVRFVSPVIGWWPFQVVPSNFAQYPSWVQPQQPPCSPEWKNAVGRDDVISLRPTYQWCATGGLGLTSGARSHAQTCTERHERASKQGEARITTHTEKISAILTPVMSYIAPFKSGNRNIENQ